MRLGALRTTLKKAGLATNLIKLGASRLLVLPHGGRVLGLFASRDDVNFLWTHDALRKVESARRLFDQHWPNPGGDRTWLAPEHELFVSDIRNPWEMYRQPRELDPAKYVFDANNGAPLLRTRASLKLHRSKTTADVRIDKTLAAVADPLGDVDLGLTFAGYATMVTLSAKTKVSISLWQLLQLPPNGEMVVRTLHRSPPRVWFGKISRADLAATDDFVHYRMRDRRRTHKIGVRAIACAGRAGYVVRRDARTFDLVVRNFFVDPSGQYVDAPFDDLRETGYAFQACNVAEDDIGHFAELEHHVPTGHVAAAGEVRARDASQVWAYRGGREAIVQAARRLLGSRFSMSRGMR
jgi:hypothetical protein